MIGYSATNGSILDVEAVLLWPSYDVSCQSEMTWLWLARDFLPHHAGGF